MKEGERYVILLSNVETEIRERERERKGLENERPMYRGGSNIEYYTVITNYATNHIMLPILYYASIYYDLKLYRTKCISHYSQH